jgi:hypothetical protein
MFFRYSHTAHLAGEKLVLVGGVNLSRHPPGVAVVNLNTGHAEEFAFPVSLTFFHLL